MLRQTFATCQGLILLAQNHDDDTRGILLHQHGTKYTNCLVIGYGSRCAMAQRFREHPGFNVIVLLARCRRHWPDAG